MARVGATVWSVRGDGAGEESKCNRGDSVGFERDPARGGGHSIVGVADVLREAATVRFAKDRSVLLAAQNDASWARCDSLALRGCAISS